MKTFRFSLHARKVACALALVLPDAAVLGAEQSTRGEEQQTLPKIKVEATDDLSSEAAYTVESAATATGLNLSLRDTPQSLTVITRERMDDQAMTTIGDALLNTTGVSLKPVDRGRNNISVRGFEVNNFQLDGIPVATGNIGIETSKAVMYDRIEVVRGATGLLSGAGDPSAAVNLVRKHANSRTFEGSFTAEFGSWNQRTGTLDLSAPMNRDGTVRLRVVASANRQDAFIDLENTKYTVFYGIIDADLGERTRLSAGASDQRDKRNGVLWAGLPYWYTDGTRTDWNRSKTTATRWNQWDTTEQSVFATLEHVFINGWSIRGDASYHAQEEDSLLLWMWGNPDRTTGEGIQAQPYHYLTKPKQVHAHIVVTGPFRLWGREHEATVGLMHSTLEDGWSNRNPIEKLAPLGDFNAWDGSYPEPALGSRYRGSAGTTTQSAVYGAARLQFTDKLKFIGGGRVSNWKRQEMAGAWTADAYQFEHSSVFTPYAGLIYDFTKRVSAYGSYTDSFKPQSNRGPDGSYLEPLKGKSYETGVKSELLDGRLHASAAVFRIDQENFAVPAGVPVIGTNTPAYRAAQGVKSQGYELEAVGELTANWKISLGWTRYSAKDGQDEDVAVDHSRKQFKLFTKYTLPGQLRRLSVGGGLKWEGERPARAINPATLVSEKVGQGAYGLVDLMAKYEWTERWSLQINVSNALDQKYRSGSYWWGSPLTYGEPRKVVVTMDYGF